MLTTVAKPSHSTSRSRRLIRVVVLIGLLGVAGWQLFVHVSAWVHLNRGKAALLRDDPADARRHLEQCLQTWPRSGEAHFFAGEAARRCGDLEAAVDHLKVAADRGWAADAIALERALVRAQEGQLVDVESGLLRDLAQHHPKSAQILAVLVPAYYTQFRIVEAGEWSARWVELEPDSIKAWELRAELMERLRRRDETIDALRQIIRLNPDHANARLTLARLLVGTHQAVEEAAGHLAWLMEHDPNNPLVLVQLAICRDAQGQTDEAIALLDKVIAKYPPDARAFHHRGRIELNLGRADAALPLLQRAADLDRSEPAILYSLLLCLQRVGTPEQIRETEARLRQCETDLKRVTELSVAVSRSPYNPDLRREMGELFLRNGREDEGLRWLQSALALQPKHQPTHRVLADYYEKVKRPDLAARHRTLATLSKGG